MHGMNIESRGTLARIKPRLRSNTRRLVVQGNCLKIYFALCLCPVVAEASEEEPGAAASNSDTTAVRMVRSLSSAARAEHIHVGSCLWPAHRYLPALL